MQKYVIKGMNVSLALPNSIARMNSMEDDPPLSAAYGSENENSQGFVLIYPIGCPSAMPYGNEQAVIAGIHNALGEDQGLIEVCSGTIGSGRKYIYSIVKPVQKMAGAQYCVTMHIDYHEFAVSIQAFYNEVGLTGVRDAAVYEAFQRDHKMTTAEWSADPYDSNYHHGILMNLSERREYDSAFLQHPLSEARAFINFIIDQN